MIKRATVSDGRTKVTFSLPAEVGPVSVVGDFNDWDPLADPLKKRSNGTRSAAVTLPRGGTFAFRYLSEERGFFDDEGADDIADNGMGGSHGVIRT